MDEFDGQRPDQASSRVRYVGTMQSDLDWRLDYIYQQRPVGFNIRYWWSGTTSQIFGFHGRVGFSRAKIRLPRCLMKQRILPETSQSKANFKILDGSGCCAFSCVHTEDFSEHDPVDFPTNLETCTMRFAEEGDRRVAVHGANGHTYRAGK